ncbi:MAG: hypothetical protein IJW57_07230 [Spirochaetaceae bacterium]|nr:hypothetical protein [Spirochaetaceae bacterium]MBR2462110.1 hypothetical protein [Spirochaetaceae bacterium]
MRKSFVSAAMLAVGILGFAYGCLDSSITYEECRDGGTLVWASPSGAELYYYGKEYTDKLFLFPSVDKAVLENPYQPAQTETFFAADDFAPFQSLDSLRRLLPKSFWDEYVLEDFEVVLERNDVTLVPWVQVSRHSPKILPCYCIDLRTEKRE